MDIAVFCGITAMAGWGCADFIQGVAIRNIGTAMVMMLRNIITLVISLSLGTYIYFQHGFQTSLPALAIISISSVIYVIGYLSYMRGFEHGKAAVVAPIASSFAIVTVLLSVVFNNETVSLLQVIAIAIMITGGLLISTDFRELKRGAPAAGVKEAFTALLFFGVAFYLAGFASQRMTAQEAFFFSALTQSIAFLICARMIGARLQQTVIYKTMFLKVFLIHALLVNGAWVGYLTGVQTGMISIVAPISSVFSGVTALLAIVIARERLYWTQNLGIVLIMAGVYTISL
ncbi:putative membrane protein [Breoghania corrubedonensis]|uniref:Putative membrane protein n=1 Tax=Breoghania corrubedonensis TaxID=665038 RepID=A0A2T5V8X0_9HYPH|nr:DMT family transporter [Breoghania corrubedonensis]PTW60205.1 putative membrane protein [Breoghania corrubedonensis]